jgi:hypothetical protein
MLPAFYVLNDFEVTEQAKEALLSHSTPCL